jgi:hypothetical protein
LDLSTLKEIKKYKRQLEDWEIACLRKPWTEVPGPWSEKKGWLCFRGKPQSQEIHEGDPEASARVAKAEAHELNFERMKGFNLALELIRPLELKLAKITKQRNELLDVMRKF